MTPQEIAHELEEVEGRLERLRIKYELYFQGIEKMLPFVARKDVDRRFAALHKEQLRSAALRFRFNSLVQRFTSYQTHWGRILRQIEEGTYKRDLRKAKRLLERIEGPSPEAPAVVEAPRDDVYELPDDDLVEEIEVPSSRPDSYRETIDLPPMPAHSVGAWRPGGPGLGALRQVPPSEPPGNDGFQEFKPPSVAPLPVAPTPTTATAPAPLPGLRPGAPWLPGPRTLSPLAGRPAMPPGPATVPPGPRPTAPGVLSPLGPAPTPPATAASPTTSAAPVRPLPAGVAPPRPVPARPAPERDDPALKALYQRYIEARRETGESTAVRYEVVARQVRDSLPKLAAQYQGADVKFDVTIKDGRAVLRPVVTVKKKAP